MNGKIKETLLPILFFAGGIGAGRLKKLPEGDFSIYALMALLLFVGLSLGMNPSIKKLFRNADMGMIMVPLGVITGTAAGNILLALILKSVTIKESLLLGAGYGYYSLSSVMISGYGLKELGATALLANIFREVITLSLAGVMSRSVCRTAPIYAGGATSMDITLPAVMKYSGKDYAFLSIFSGLVLSLAVPLIITLLLRL